MKRAVDEACFLLKGMSGDQIMDVLFYGRALLHELPAVSESAINRMWNFGNIIHGDVESFAIRKRIVSQPEAAE